jgi:hypothetical protein
VLVLYAFLLAEFVKSFGLKEIFPNDTEAPSVMARAAKLKSSSNTVTTAVEFGNCDENEILPIDMRVQTKPFW